MLAYLVDAIEGSPVAQLVVVVSSGVEPVSKRMQADVPDVNFDFVEHRRSRGTGDTVAVGLTALTFDGVDDGDLLIVPGDTPLLRAETVDRLVAAHQAGDAACTILTTTATDGTGWGRIARDKHGAVRGVVADSMTVEGDTYDEESWATLVYCFRTSVLAPALRRLEPGRGDVEYYLADVVEVLVDAGYSVETVACDDAGEMLAVNDRVELARAEAELRRRTNEHWLRSGVTMVDPATTYIDATAELGTDVTIFPNTILQGRTVVGNGAELGPDTRLIDCMVGVNARVEKTVGRDAEIGPDAKVGPFASLEVGAQVEASTVTGPFYVARSTSE